MSETDEVRNVTIYQVVIENNNPNFNVDDGVWEVRTALTKFLNSGPETIRVRPLRCMRNVNKKGS